MVSRVDIALIALGALTVLALALLLAQVTAVLGAIVLCLYGVVIGVAVGWLAEDRPLSPKYFAEGWLIATWVIGVLVWYWRDFLAGSPPTFWSRQRKE